MSPSLAEALAVPALDAAPRVLGSVLRSTIGGKTVAVRITEVEAYNGFDDPGSHAYRGKTARNAALFGPPGRLYVYFNYGMHWAANVVTGVDGIASGLLLRAGEVIEGLEVAALRRPAAKTARDYARGPACLAQALGIDKAQCGHDLSLPPVTLELAPMTVPAAEISAGPRVGVSGPGGDATDFPWRFWITGDPTVSVYRPAVKRVRPAIAPEPAEPPNAEPPDR